MKNPRFLTGSERSLVANALRVACEVYRQDASNARKLVAENSAGVRMVDAFERQADESDTLAGLFEDADAVTLFQDEVPL